MTQTEWLACADPLPMLDSLRGSERKLRLYGCACTRQVWHLLADKRSRDAVAATERFAEGALSSAELEVAAQAAWRLVTSAETVVPPPGVATTMAWQIAYHTPNWRVFTGRAVRALGTEATVAGLLRCIFNPFGPSGAPPWHAAEVPRLAHAAYEERSMPAGTLDPGRLAVLADALEEAGCNDAALLDHLHHPGPHVRGCWPVDLLTGRR
jgi:hypothetical protein